MKIKNDYMLRKVADSYVVVPTGREVANFNGLINLNEAAALLWHCMEEEISEDDLVLTLMNHYEVDESTAKHDIKEFIRQLQENRILDESI